MLSFLSRHSSILLIAAGFAGFAFPDLSASALPFLPYVLFTLMLFTLIGIDQRALVKAIIDPGAWVYALVHCGVTTIVVSIFGIAFGASTELLMAATAVCATGTLFATPAIVRSVGFAPLKAMAFTITSTLMMPVALYVNLVMLSTDEFTLDLQDYCLRLFIFIFGPMLFSYTIHKLVPEHRLSRIHGKLAQFTIILVFSFPFGLTGQYRWLWDSDRSFAITMLFIAFAICVLFFVIGLALYWNKGRSEAYVAAITSGNRNVLLTYSVAGAFLGPLYLPLIGALQLPIYMQPVLVKFFLKRDGKRTAKA
ncbi:hypothetical protein GCE9029_02965 [Grimontia celer]|uniref:Sodium Bile acid symporter family protein n=1 Tax=Grimontia celer TaxID=1796497 RepID=A0A128F5E1_9GAMM|nr:hypothetical protein [Grimontia celer]CZF81999.1 hypothetical protein GCE9029_02965 [Grimontia celer]